MWWLKDPWEDNFKKMLVLCKGCKGWLIGGTHETSKSLPLIVWLLVLLTFRNTDTECDSIFGSHQNTLKSLKLSFWRIKSWIFRSKNSIKNNVFLELFLYFYYDSGKWRSAIKRRNTLRALFCICLILNKINWVFR